MTFAWPEMLWLLLVLPVLLAVYVYLMRRKQRVAVRYASLAMLKDAMRSSQHRRHVPPALFFLAIAAMIVAIARPAAVVTLPSQHETVVLAIDVSGSMRANDVEPNRLAAAQAAARTFVAEQPRGTRIAVVAFAATALVVQHPTQDREDILSAIERRLPAKLNCRSRLLSANERPSGTCGTKSTAETVAPTSCTPASSRCT